MFLSPEARLGPPKNKLPTNANIPIIHTIRISIISFFSSVHIPTYQIFFTFILT